MLNRLSASVLLACLLTAGLACSPNQSPDQIREKTAEETSAIKRDTKAVAEGVKEGLSGKKSVDLNKASRAELSALPGITDKQADHIIAERPYADAHQLVTRHVLTEDEYSQIQDRVIVTR
jgi:DNA uptake protein ComE-like DNA-binding protein